MKRFALVSISELFLSPCNTPTKYKEALYWPRYGRRVKCHTFWSGTSNGRHRRGSQTYPFIQSNGLIGISRKMIALRGAQWKKGYKIALS